MNDLISRKALLAEYDRVHIGEPGQARKLIADAPSVDAPHWATEQAYKNGYEAGKPKWIPVSERLPKDNSRSYRLVLLHQFVSFATTCRFYQFAQIIKLCWIKSGYPLNLLDVV